MFLYTFKKTDWYAYFYFTSYSFIYIYLYIQYKHTKNYPFLKAYNEHKYMYIR